MAEKIPGKTKRTSRKKTASQTAANVTPINQGGLPHEVTKAGDGEANTRASEPSILEQIRIRAYELFEERGRLDGFDQEDWARAEAEVLEKYQREKSA